MSFNQSFRQWFNQLSSKSLIVAMLVTSGLITGCSGYQSRLTSTLTGNDRLSDGGKDGGSVDSPAVAWNKLEVAGEVEDGRFKGSQVLRLDKVNKELILNLPMPASPFLDNTQLTLPLRQLAGASIQLDPIEGGGSALTLHVPLASLVRGVDFAEPSKLPNGQPLPGVPDGELPSEALSLTNLTTIKATIYLGKNVVGVFVNTPINPLIALSYPIKSMDGATTWGYLHTIPASTLNVTAKDGGFFIEVQMPDEIARIIDDAL